MPLRVASLLPAATEIVCALGARGQLVGVSHECDFPDGVSALPVLTRTRLHGPGRSEQIDRDLRALVGQALAVYEVDVAALERARPDVVVTQDLCDVCAVSFAAVAEAVAGLAAGAEIVRLSPLRLSDVWDDVARVAAALGRERDGAELLARLRGRLDALAARTAGLPRPRVLTLEWLSPPMVGGTWMPELVALAGGEPLVSRPGDHAPTLSPGQLAALDPPPDVVLVKPCGFPLPRTLAERDVLAALLPPHWPAVREGQVFVADGNAYFNRPGPRLVESAEILAACVHPQVFGDLAARHAAGFVRLG